MSDKSDGIYVNSHKENEYIPFPKIGQGSQHHAYDTHDGRVLKIPLTREETYLTIGERRHNINPRSDEEVASLDARVHTLLNGKGRIPSMLQHPFENPEAFLQLIGNPKAIDSENILPEDTPEKQWGVGRVVYTQDLALMNHQVLRELNQLKKLGASDIKRFQQVIDMYLDLTYKMWGFGYADYVFKLGDTGFNSKGNMIFVDLGEFSHDPAFILRALEEQRWLHAIMPTKVDFPQIPSQLQAYYEKTMGNALTAEKFQQHWRSTHQCTACTPSNDVISTFIAAKAAEIDYIDRW
jgi:hypothetical protein